jgi:hypothetical protein
LEKHVSSIERELASFWRLGDAKVAPEGFLGLREQLILNDLILMHRIWKGVSTISFDEFFTICDHQKKTDAEIKAKRYKKTFAKYTECTSTGIAYLAKHETSHREPLKKKSKIC